MGDLFYVKLFVLLIELRRIHAKIWRRGVRPGAAFRREFYQTEGIRTWSRERLPLSYVGGNRATECRSICIVQRFAQGPEQVRNMHRCAMGHQNFAGLLDVCSRA